MVGFASWPFHRRVCALIRGGSTAMFQTRSSAFSRPANPRTRLVEVLQGDLVKHIG